jgi:hypothetical protein
MERVILERDERKGERWEEGRQEKDRNKDGKQRMIKVQNTE